VSIIAVLERVLLHPLLTVPECRFGSVVSRIHRLGRAARSCMVARHKMIGYGDVIVITAAYGFMRSCVNCASQIRSPSEMTA